VKTKTTGTTIAAKTPKAYIGMILLPAQDANATVDVKDVMNIDLLALLKVKVNLFLESSLIAFIKKEPSQKSWKTKMSSAPMPTMTMMMLI
jgi:hypothetical protein